MLSRLSGSTAEFLSIWNLMMSGHQPFLLLEEQPQPNEEHCAVLSLKPILPGWLFDSETQSISYTFLGSIQVTYRNPGLINTWEGKSFTGIAISRDSDEATGLEERYSTVTTVTEASEEKRVEYFDCHVSALARNGKIKSIDLLIL
jgi:hypothetical protein